MTLAAGTSTIAVTGGVATASGTGMALRIAQSLASTLLQPAIAAAVDAGMPADAVDEAFGTGGEAYAGIANAVAAGVVAELVANGHAIVEADAFGPGVPAGPVDLELA